MIDGRKSSDKQSISFGNIYELNKDLVNKYEKTLTKEEIENKKQNVILKFLEEREKNFYFMLLCHEQRDYTLFNFIDYKGEDTDIICADELIECLLNRGKIKGIDITKDNNAIEIWISIDKEAFAYYFFPYDSGVIEINYKGGHTYE